MPPEAHRSGCHRQPAPRTCMAPHLGGWRLPTYTPTSPHTPVLAWAFTLVSGEKVSGLACSSFWPFGYRGCRPQRLSRHLSSLRHHGLLNLIAVSNRWASVTSQDCIWHHGQLHRVHQDSSLPMLTAVSSLPLLAHVGPLTRRPAGSKLSPFAVCFRTRKETGQCS